MKRIFDILFSFIGLIFLFPLFIIVTVIIIIIEKNDHVFFVQQRIGKDFKPFNLYKFRTMVNNTLQKGLSVTAEGDPRITKVGRILRKTKIDELPQLVNVLKGDMSLVGYRPEALRFVEMFKNDYKDILKIKPGITDYATIEFRNEENILKKYSDPEEGYIKEVLPMKIELYKRYLRDKSFITDMRLIFLTLWKIIKV